MKKFDILFIDPVAYKHYDVTTLDTEALGGTESTVIRVAEGLAARGLTVGVANKCTQEATMGAFAYYLPANDSILDTNPTHVISLRGTSGMSAFPKAFKYSWQHDYPDERITPMIETFLENNVIVISVSEFHTYELQRRFYNDDWTKVPKIKRIYNPLDPRILVDRKTKVPYDRNSLVWAASPHKGLKKALEQFQILKKILPDIKLKVFQPGYLENEFHNIEGVINYGPVPCQKLWQEMSGSLCTFYPTDFLETFGLIASESNAVHTPIATMRIGALNESVQTENQTVHPGDFPGLLKKIEMWYNEPNTRPSVSYQPRFTLNEVLDQWIQMFRKREQSV